MKNHHFVKIALFEIAQLFNNAFIMISEKTSEAFQCTSIYPFNSVIFTIDNFAASDLQNNSIVDVRI